MSGSAKAGTTAERHTCELRVLIASIVRAPPKRASGESFSPLTRDLHGCRQTGNYHWCAHETCLKTDLTPSALFHQTNLTLPPLDPQSWILLIPIVSHVSECSTIRKTFALSRRDDNGAETSTRVAKKGKARSRRNLGLILPHYSKI